MREEQGGKTVTFENGDVYTGQLDEQGRRQGRGRCKFAATVATSTTAGTQDGVNTPPKGADAVATGAGSGEGDGVYDGEWDNDMPHGRGERVYPAPSSAGMPGGGTRVEKVDFFGCGGENTDTATDVAAAFTHHHYQQSPVVVLSYSGNWNHSVREGYGTCRFVFDDAANSSTRCTRGPDGSAGVHGSVDVPHLYEGEWVNGRPQGRGTLTLRAQPETTTTINFDVRTGQNQNRKCAGRGGKAFGGGGGGDTRGYGSVIKGLWEDERGLIHGRQEMHGNDGGVYEGEYRLGRREGHGRLEFPDGSEYEGAWRNGRQNGLGVFRCGLTRQVYTGKWVGGVRCGRGEDLRSS
ncbi:unnamed protein product [Sphacelaria rigidula]